MSSFGATAVVTPARVTGAAPPAGPHTVRRPPLVRPAPPEPDFGPHVRVFGPGDPAAEIQAAFDAAGPGPAASASGAPASAGHPRAFLFKPGTYRLDAELGPHTSAVGLGPAPEAVTVHGTLRAADPTAADAAGSVAAGLRRSTENLNLVPAESGSAGGSPAGSSEKPFLYVDGTGAYRVFLPALRHGGAGTAGGRAAYGWSVPIDRFFVARPGDSVRALNRALAQGRHLLLTPGLYRLTDTVRVKWAGTVVLGLGSVTLAPVGATVPMTVADARGVRIAGLMFDAGPATPPVLLEVGRSGGGRCDPREPASVQDVFFRLGGAEDGRALVAHSDHVLLEGVWAWRAGRAVSVGAAGCVASGAGGDVSGVPEHPGVRFHDLPALPCGEAGVRDHAVDGGGAAQGTGAVPR
ncbi:hypothetical protein [Actinacidiphila acidipaludis]|uniref:Pectate lyase superfamily protein domain-containing protein n=1 Tax=Actinacidiphila acidipaludis TaxID=2873382 RepID=A0ABS7Q793_9ACTN|nr:hypothetical protein [Streptomyces acidipaludis]MBY8879013.1 hypothetical protein [Streptomyces acidipaludis]